jgi:transcriptional regulator with XRE-family HTH domain
MKTLLSWNLIAHSSLEFDSSPADSFSLFPGKGQEDYIAIPGSLVKEKISMISKFELTSVGIQGNRSMHPEGFCLALFRNQEKRRVALASSDFGPKLKARRRARGMTLKQLAAKTGLSVGLLSEVERGLAQPSMSSLKKIAQAMQFSLFDFGDEQRQVDNRETRSVSRLEQDPPWTAYRNDIKVVRSGNRKKLIYPKLPAVFELLTPDLNRAFEVLYVRFEPGFTSGPEPIVDPPGEKCVFILSGGVELQVGKKTIRLLEGDSACYPGNAPMSVRVIGDEAAKSVFIVTPPSF